jgi:Mg2+ and Co2+ transporter CorA
LQSEEIVEANEEIKRRISDSLHSGIDLDQIIILEAELITDPKGAAEISMTLHQIQEHAAQNSENLKTARRLLSGIR